VTVVTTLTRTVVEDVLGTVRDPELDEPITELGFVVDVRIDDGAVAVDLRLPTFFCAPNFAYLMAADAQAAVSALPGVRSVSVRLVDHLADDRISAGLADDAGFARTFDGETDGDDLDELRATFARKAYLARTHAVCTRLVGAGHDPGSLVELPLAALEPLRTEPDGDREVGRFLARRAELGMPTATDAPLLLDVWGAPVPRAQVADHLRRARTVHVSIEGNAGFCRGLLDTRYAPGGTGSDAGRLPLHLATAIPDDRGVRR
jgi:metal-sulfur cluster biosynthetic enzyme